MPSCPATLAVGESVLSPLAAIVGVVASCGTVDHLVGLLLAPRVEPCAPCRDAERAAANHDACLNDHANARLALVLVDDDGRVCTVQSRRARLRTEGR